MAARTSERSTEGGLPGQRLPITSWCTSEVPSYVSTDSRLFACRITGYSRVIRSRPGWCGIPGRSRACSVSDLLQCLEWMESPVWAPPGGPRPDDHWAKIPATAKARWRKTAELSIGVGTAPGVPATYLIGHVGTDSDWNEDNWARATWTAQELIKEAGKRAKRDLTAFYPGGTWVAAMRDLTDETVFYVGGAGEPHEVSMPSEEDTMNHVWVAQLRA